MILLSPKHRIQSGQKLAILQVIDQSSIAQPSQELIIKRENFDFAIWGASQFGNNLLEQFLLSFGGNYLVVFELRVFKMFAQKMHFDCFACTLSRVLAELIFGQAIDIQKRTCDQNEQAPAEQESKLPFQTRFTQHAFDGTV